MVNKMVTANQTINARIKRKDVTELISAYPSWAHPDVHYWQYDWQILRDVVMGEREIKANGGIYLPKPSGMTTADYAFYLDNATYFNMCARTLSALVGTIFRRNPVISDLPKKLESKIAKISSQGQSLRTFTRRATREIMHMGRFGVLVDMPSGGGDAYLTGYKAEAMLDWRTQAIDGREELVYMVLMEIAEQKENLTGSPRQFDAKFRVLRLVPASNARGWKYVQELYHNNGRSGEIDLATAPNETITPTNRGVPLDFIPFKIFGPDSNNVDTERSPLLDVANMNLSHYRSYAHLEHGRFYTGLPVYWISKNDASGQGEYTIGPSMVWEIQTGEKAGLMEFNGNGLKFLENAIAVKEGHVAALGGRLIGVTTRSVSESDNQVSMKERNEHATLLSAALSLDEGFSEVLGWWAVWNDVPKTTAAKITIEFNKDFILKEVAAREFRAVHSMYTDGLLPIDVVYDYLSKAEVIPDWMTFEEFSDLIKKKNSFPMQPDAGARDRDFPDRKTELELELEDDKMEKAEESAANADARALEAAREQQSAAAETAEKTAAATAVADKARNNQSVPNND